MTIQVQLEDLADAMVTELTAGLANAVTALTIPVFTARWDYDNTYRLEDHTPEDPADVLIVVKEEELDIDTPVSLAGEFQLDIGIRAKIGTYDRDTVLNLRKLADAVFYYWFPRANRRLTAIDMTWLKTDIQAVFVPGDLLQKHLFFTVATLTFQGTRDE